MFILKSSQLEVVCIFSYSCTPLVMYNLKQTFYSAHNTFTTSPAGNLQRSDSLLKLPGVNLSNSSQYLIFLNLSIQVSIFLVKFSLIFRSLSGPNSTHFLTGQFVCRTVRPDSPVDMTGKINK